MEDKQIFSIGEQHAGRDILNVGRDLYINQNSPPEDILIIIEALQHKIYELGILENSKEEIRNNLDNVKNELEDKNLNTKLIGEKIKKINGIIKETKISGENLKYIGTLIGKITFWLGTTSV